MDEIKPYNFQEYVLNEYKKKAIYEAEQMHDWNSAKLYSEKALKSLETDIIYPEQPTYWKLPTDKIKEIQTAYENLMIIYQKAKIVDPENLAIAISSLDCWSEQQEEKWQIWDIDKCKEDFLNSMHELYEKISIDEKKEEQKNQNTKKENESTNELTMISKNEDNDLVQIIYFDFDKFNLSNVSKNKIKLFLEKYGNKINEYSVIGHTDTKGTKKYNLSLSIERAKVVQGLLISEGIDQSKIKIFGEGENSLAIITPDNTRQPANRRVEIKKLN